MTAGELLDKWLVKAKGLAPYVICISLAGLGLGMFKVAGDYAKEFPAPSVGMAWMGVLFCGLAFIALGLWHFWQYPRWFQIGKPATAKKPTIQNRTKKRV